MQSILWAARWGNTPDPQSVGLFASCTGWISRYSNEGVTVRLDPAQATLDHEGRARLCVIVLLFRWAALRDGLHLSLTTQHLVGDVESAIASTLFL